MVTTTACIHLCDRSTEAASSVSTWLPRQSARRTRVRSVPFSPLRCRVRLSSRSAGLYVNARDLAVDVVLSLYSVIVAPGTWTCASCAAPPRPSGKQGTHPWTVASTSGRCPGRLALTSGTSDLRLPANVGAPRVTSALPFLCFAELSDSLGPLVPTFVTSCSSCPSKLGS